MTAHAQTVANAGFESGTLSSWIYSVGSVTWSATNAHTGTGAVNITNHGTCLQVINGLTPNTTYKLVAWAKLGAPCTAWVGVNNYGAAQVMATVTGTTYQQYTVDFTTGATNTSATVWVGNGSTSGTVYADDFAIGYKPLSDPANSGNWLANNALSDEFNGTTLDTAKWRTWSYWPGRAPSQYDPANVAVFGGCAHLYTQNRNMLVNGNFETDTLTGWTYNPGDVVVTPAGTTSEAVTYYGAKIVTPGAMMSQTVAVQPNTEYLFSANYRVSSTGTLPKVTLGTVNPVTSFTSVGSTWLKNQSVKFTTAAEQTAVTIYARNDGGAGSIAYVDDLSLVQATSATGFKFGAGNYIAASTINGYATPTFGYYEARMKLADDAHFSAFWLRQEYSGSIKAQEIDIQEQIGDPDYFTTAATQVKATTHYFPTNGSATPDWKNNVTYSTGVRLADAFHVYAVDWQPDQVRFYYDGTLIKTMAQVVPPLVPTADNMTQVLNMQTLFFDTEVFTNYGIPNDGSSSDFQIDYVRVWTH